MPDAKRRALTGWGRTAPSVAEVVETGAPGAAASALAGAGPRGSVPRGLGRSYGDAAQNGGGRVIAVAGLGAIGAVDAECGTVSAGGGVDIEALLSALVPQGWFVPVTPGTRHVTIGGAIAADVHGKNHHLDGSLGGHIVSLDLLTADGARRRLSPEQDAEAFWATVGGMGLTGVILEATMRLIPIDSARLVVDTERTADLEQTMTRMAEGDERYRYSVAWVDLVTRGRGFGRGVLSRGNHPQRMPRTPGWAPVPGPLPPTTERDGPLAYQGGPRVPAPLAPPGLVNRATARAFNEAWFRKAPARREGERQSIDEFFYPLDALDGWPRVYGPGGFIQHQCVVPFGAERVLESIALEASRQPVPATLVVLKRFGAPSEGHLSFPIPGWTLAIDFPAARDEAFAAMLDRWDERIAEAGGRVYLAKDGRMRREVLSAMYPRLDEWRAVRDRLDPDGRLTSDLDRRLNLTGKHDLTGRHDD